MLKTLHIKNFKGWSDTGKIEMAPITLFFGTNSSGKSSIGQFLMMLKQTVESSDRKTVFSLGGANAVVDLGSYREMVSGRDIKKKISFEYDWSFSPEIQFKDSYSKKTYKGTRLSFQAEVGFGDERALAMPLIENLEYKLYDKNNLSLGIAMIRSGSKEQKYEVKATQYKLKRQMGRGWPIKTPYKFYGFPDEFLAYYQNAVFAQDIAFQHERLFKSIYYLGPLRDRAERSYRWAGEEDESVGYAGRNTIPAFLAAQKRMIAIKPEGAKRADSAKRFDQIIADTLYKLGLIKEQKFNVKAISDSRIDYEVKLSTHGSNVSVDLPDVGFGVSQVLPVLVQCFCAPKNSIIIMEQPEIHLHPSAQSALADVMIDVINSKENGEDRNIQLIIETHSEHFLRRLQSRIAQGAISKDKVSAYFANTTQSLPRLEKLEIDLFGNIRNWPDNFFGDVAGDIADQAEASLKTRLAQIKKK